MMKSVFLETFELSEKDGILLLHPTGERPDGSEVKAHKIIRDVKHKHLTDKMLLDMRDAHYPLTETQVGLRAASFSREVEAFNLAIVCLSAQSDMAEVLSRAHTKLSGTNKIFSSRDDAVEWLLSL